MRTHTERERKYELPPDAQLPSLSHFGHFGRPAGRDPRRGVLRHRGPAAEQGRAHPAQAHRWQGRRVAPEDPARCRHPRGDPVPARRLQHPAGRPGRPHPRLHPARPTRAGRPHRHPARRAGGWSTAPAATSPSSPTTTSRPRTSVRPQWTTGASWSSSWPAKTDASLLDRAEKRLRKAGVRPAGLRVQAGQGARPGPAARSPAAARATSSPPTCPARSRRCCATTC